MSPTREKTIESYVAQRVKGFLVKFTSPGESGVPDRIHLKNGGTVTFIEFKKPGGVLSARQKLWIDRLKAMGHEVIVIGSMEEAKAYVASVSAQDG